MQTVAISIIVKISSVHLTELLKYVLLSLIHYPSRLRLFTPIYHFGLPTTWYTRNDSEAGPRNNFNNSSSTPAYPISLAFP